GGPGTLCVTPALPLGSSLLTGLPATLGARPRHKSPDRAELCDPGSGTVRRLPRQAARGSPRRSSPGQCLHGCAPGACPLSPETLGWPPAELAEGSLLAHRTAVPGIEATYAWCPPGPATTRGPVPRRQPARGYSAGPAPADPRAAGAS